MSNEKSDNYLSDQFCRNDNGFSLGRRHPSTVPLTLYVAPSLKLYARSSGCCKTLTSWGLSFRMIRNNHSEDDFFFEVPSLPVLFYSLEKNCVSRVPYRKFL